MKKKSKFSWDVIKYRGKYRLKNREGMYLHIYTWANVPFKYEAGTLVRALQVADFFRRKKKLDNLLSFDDLKSIYKKIQVRSKIKVA